MSRFLRVVLGVVLGYAGGGALGVALVSALSSNSHDKALETVMTAAFVTGPAGALVGLIAALALTRPKA